MMFSFWKERELNCFHLLLIYMHIYTWHSWKSNASFEDDGAHLMFSWFPRKHSTNVFCYLWTGVILAFQPVFLWSLRRWPTLNLISQLYDSWDMIGWLRQVIVVLNNDVSKNKNIFKHDLRRLTFDFDINKHIHKFSSFIWHFLQLRKWYKTYRPAAKLLIDLCKRCEASIGLYCKKFSQNIKWKEDFSCSNR